MSVFTERVGLELLLLVQGLPSSLLEKIKTKKRERELSSHVPNITFRPRVNYMATMKSTSPPSPIISITETAVKQHMKHLS